MTETQIVEEAKNYLTNNEIIASGYITSINAEYPEINISNAYYGNSMPGLISVDVNIKLNLSEKQLNKLSKKVISNKIKVSLINRDE